MKYSEDQSELRLFFPRLSARPLDISLPRLAWVRLNRLRTAVGRFQSSLHKTSFDPASVCECGPLDQTTSHLILQCPIHRESKGYHGLLVMDNETRCWLNNIAANI